MASAHMKKYILSNTSLLFMQIAVMTSSASTA
jgi:hypothetical protein